jgi:hypothetical protein
MPDAPAPTIPDPTTTPWRESALTRAAELRGLANAYAAEQSKDQEAALLAEARQHIAAAEQAATGAGLRRGERRVAALWGASVERAISQLDAAEVCLLRVAPPEVVIGQLPSLYAQTRDHLPATDPRLQRLAALDLHYGKEPPAGIAPPVATALTAIEREAIVTAFRAGALEARRQVTRVRSFRNVLLVSALVLTLCVAGLTVAATARPALLPLCFTPIEAAVCPTHTEAPKAETAAATPAPAPTPGGATPTSGMTNAQEAAQAVALDRLVRSTASSWDVPLVELVGLIAAAVAAAVALRGMRGTSTPYSLPTALAVLKLPTGALTAVLGILLMRGAFVPGLSALDSSGQILAWAIVFGAAQQLVTRLVDQKAQGVLDELGTPGKSKTPDAPEPATPG